MIRSSQPSSAGRFTTLLCIALVSGVGALDADDSATAKSDERMSYFEKHVRPLLIQHCYECHSTESGKRQGGLLLDSHEGWRSGGDRGEAIVPGDVESSLLIRAVRYSNDEIQMPPEGELTAAEISILETWVRGGAVDPRQPNQTSAAVSPAASDPVAGRDHWAFSPLYPPLPPDVHARHWPRSNVDAFVLSRLEAEGLTPSPQADRDTLLRRLHFMLLGLPPSAEEIASFVNDADPMAYQRRVDRLLASPQFGQRWGRHWMDLARYADSNGLDENFLFREAWRYRNWTIDVLNQDMPLDRFALEQIAGDLLPFDSIEQRDRQRIAAGFLVVGPKVLLGNDPKERRLDIADEQLDTIGKTFLGMTLGCARCHDHKFDPIPTADYYAMAGILTSTNVLETRHMLGQQREMEQLTGLGADGESLDTAYETYWRNSPEYKRRFEQAQAAMESLKKHDEAAFTKLAEEHKDAVADGAIDPMQSIEIRIEAQSKFVKGLAVSFKPLDIPPRAMSAMDVESPSDESIRLAGQFDRLGETVPRGVLQVVGDTGISIPDGQSGRVQLAAWLADADHGAGRIMARVLANRVWHHLMGRGLVRTVDNLGRTGESPSHPELLDYLANELIESGWSIKSLVRTIVSSRTFMMDSGHVADAFEVDPDNRWLWRSNRRRLDPESLRDAMLQLGDQLDLAPVGSTVGYLDDQATAVGANKNRRRTDFPCRSVYLPVIRNDLPEWFDSFDFADPHATTGLRPQTIVVTQAFLLMNDGSVMAAADAIANKVLRDESNGSDGEIASAMARLVLGHRSDSEVERDLVAFVESARNWAREGSERAQELGAWSAACQALLSSSQFQILE